MIKAPNWAQDATPTTRGWVGNKGELLKSQNISPQEIKEYYGEPEPVVEATPVKRTRTAKVSTLTEAPVSGKSLDEMTEVELQNIHFDDVAPEVLTEESGRARKGWFNRD